MLILRLALVTGVAWGQALSPALPAQQETSQHSPLSPTEISKLQAQAGAGDASAEEKLARAYETGNGVPENYDLAVKWYRKAADQGDPVAQNGLGVMYLLGRGVERNKETAVSWYRKAARLGNGAAMYNLGAAYYNGEGVVIDDTYAYAWFLLAEETGYDASEAVQRSERDGTPFHKLEALTKVAEMYEKGDDLPQNRAETVKWYRKAADGGNTAASVKLASLLTEGAPTNADYAEALHRCEDAAKRKYPPGATCVGFLYQHGLGVAANPVEAAKWFGRAAELGNAQAMLYLGEAYWKGQGVSADKITAYMWIFLASSSSIPEAKQEEAALRGEMAKKDVERPPRKRLSGTGGTPFLD